ncbi:MAG: DEAD/DEAH box helicase, partial [Blastocatellia bacterium]
VDFRGLSVQGGDFVDAELGSRLMKADAPETVARAYCELAANRKAIVFTPTVPVARATAEAFVSRGVPAEYLDGSMRHGIRRDTLNRFRNGDTKVLTNCNVLTEGFDEPSVDCIIIARPTRSPVLYPQMLGRGLRPFAQKKDCLVLDVVGSTADLQLQTAAGMFGLEPEELEDRTVHEAKLYQHASQKGKGKGVARAVSAGSTSGPNNGRLVSYEIDVFTGQRRLNWLSAENGARVLAVPGGAVYVTQTQQGYGVFHRQARSQPKLLIDELTEEYAMGAAEDAARRLGAAPLVDRQAKWRLRPATPVQIRRLSVLGHRNKAGSRMTQGEASDLITRLEATQYGES